MKNILFIGAGVMGGPMATNLSKKGFNVTLWNRNPQRSSYKNAIAKGCLAMKALECELSSFDTIITCVKDDQTVRDLFRQMDVTSIRKDTIIIDMSTIGVKAAKSLQQEFSERNINFLDAPVSGGEEGAVSGKLTIMVGGSQSVYEQSLPIFKAMGEHIHYCGQSGSGQAVKLVNQLLCSVHMRALCEAMTLAEHLELNLDQVIDICSSGAAGSWALKYLGPKIARRDFNPGFSIDLMLKDIRLVKDSSTEILDKLQALELSESAFKQAAQGDDPEKLATQAMIKSFT